MSSTWQKPSANAGVVPGRTIRTSSALEEVALYSAAITTTRVPLSRASVSQCESGILVQIQFIPHATIVLAFSTVTRYQSSV